MPAIESFRVEEIPQQVLEHHKVKIIGYDDYFWGRMVNEGSIYVEPSRSKLNGLECIFDVLIGRFYLVVHVLNILKRAEDKKNLGGKEDSQGSNLGQGTFGVVKLAEVEGKKVAIKRLMFTRERKQVVSIPGLLDSNDLFYPD